MRGDQLEQRLGLGPVHDHLAADAADALAFAQQLAQLAQHRLPAGARLAAALSAPVGGQQAGLLVGTGLGVGGHRSKRCLISAADCQCSPARRHGQAGVGRQAHAPGQALRIQGHPRRGQRAVWLLAQRRRLCGRFQAGHGGQGQAGGADPGRLRRRLGLAAEDGDGHPGGVQRARGLAGGEVADGDAPLGR
jgi:hypothetical protein